MVRKRKVSRERRIVRKGKGSWKRKKEKQECRTVRKRKMRVGVQNLIDRVRDWVEH